MANWYTSDTHFFHARIIILSKRQFVDVEEMHRVLIRNWNRRVQPGDTVYHLGDFGFGSVEKLNSIIQALNGHLVLVRGNHDRTNRGMLNAGFHEVVPELYLEENGVNLYLHHEPMPWAHWNGKADLHLCGHVHEAWERKNTPASGPVINVGVDVRGMQPVSLEELLS